jgi:predicted phosphodiesterase
VCASARRNGSGASISASERPAPRAPITPSGSGGSASGASPIPGGSGEPFEVSAAAARPRRTSQTSSAPSVSPPIAAQRQLPASVAARALDVVGVEMLERIDGACGDQAVAGPQHEHRGLGGGDGGTERGEPGAIGLRGAARCHRPLTLPSRSADGAGAGACAATVRPPPRPNAQAARLLPDSRAVGWSTASMKVAIISDIHGNRQAFEAVLRDIVDASVTEVWCLGDLVGYGADPDACVDLARDNADLCLAGNHDLAVAGKLPLDDFSRGAAISVRWTQDVIAPANRDFLATLRPSAVRAEVGLYHGSPRDAVWEYVASVLLAELCFDAASHRLNLLGHSHVALSFERHEGLPATGEARRADTVLDISGGEWLLNPGSVGQPRDGDPRAAWLLLDLDELTARYQRCDYDIPGAAGAIRAARLPDSLAERLEYGQ